MSAIPDDRVAEIKAALDRGDQLTAADRDDLIVLLIEFEHNRVALRRSAEREMGRRGPGE